MSKTLFVGGLAFNTKEKDLQKYFERFGAIRRVRIIKDTKTKASKGYGFVYFFKQEPVSDILKERTHRVNGRRVDCQGAMDKSEKGKYKEKLSKTRIFVTRLSDHVSNEDMNDFFARFGPVKSAYVIRDPDSNKSLGFGFVIFEHPDDAQKTVGNPDLFIKGEKINCKNYKENDGEFSNCFDPVGKRLKNNNGKGSKTRAKEDRSFNKRQTMTSETPKFPRGGPGRDNLQVSEKRQCPGRRIWRTHADTRTKESRPKPDLFSLDEERLQMNEKLSLEKEFYLINSNHFGLSHSIGHNLRLNCSSTTSRNRHCNTTLPYQRYHGYGRKALFWN